MDGGAGQAVQGAPARTRHWLRALLRRRFVKALMVASLVALLLVPLREAGWLQGLELSSYDRLVTFFAGPQESDRVVLVVTTEADINRFGYPIRDNDLAAVLARVFAAAPKAVGVDLYRDLPMPPGNEALQAIQRAQDKLYWVFKLPDEGNTGVPPPPVLRESWARGAGRPRDGCRWCGAPGATAGRRRTDRHKLAHLGVALAERYTGERLRPLDDDLALGQGRIPLLNQPYGPYAVVDAAGYQMLLRLSRRPSALPPDQLRRDRRPARAGGDAPRPHCAGRHRSAFHQG